MRRWLLIVLASTLVPVLASQSEARSKALNPQPIPPGKMKALNPQPIPPGRIRMLNPQPIPPGKPHRRQGKFKKRF